MWFPPKKPPEKGKRDTGKSNQQMFIMYAKNLTELSRDNSQTQPHGTVTIK